MSLEIALFTFGIGVKRCTEGASWRRHFAGEPADRLLGALAEQVLARVGISERQKLEELGIVVKHLLEMRHQPFLIDRIAREAAAQMVVDAALAHALKRELDQLEKARVAGAQAGAPDEFQHRALREFRRAAEPAIHRIERPGKRGRGQVELAGTDIRASAALRLAAERRHESRAVMLDAGRLVAKQTGDFVEDIDKAGPAITRRLRKIGASPDRFAGGSEEHGQRPATLFAEMMQCRHVDLVDIGPLLAIDLDVDEQPVHDGGGRLVLEALMGHHVAPVAGRVSYRQHDRLVAARGLLERVRAPRPPVHRIMFVLQEIGTRFAGEAILADRRRRTCHEGPEGSFAAGLAHRNGARAAACSPDCTKPKSGFAYPGRESSVFGMLWPRISLALNPVYMHPPTQAARSTSSNWCWLKSLTASRSV